ncbi:MAG: hypothetical protein ACJA00_005575 [Myxococcota bacterium]
MHERYVVRLLPFLGVIVGSCAGAAAQRDEVYTHQRRKMG